MSLTNAVEQLFQELKANALGQHELQILDLIEQNIQNHKYTVFLATLRIETLRQLYQELIKTKGQPCP